MAHRIGGIDDDGAAEVGLAVVRQLAFHRLLVARIGHCRQGHVGATCRLFLGAEGPGPTRSAVGEIVCRWTRPR